MPKSLPILPSDVRKSGTLELGRIPINQYRSDPVAESTRFGRASLVRMYRDMVLIREFETMLQRIKVQGSYEGIAYEHKGPAHLSIGQEAAAVGMAFPLGPDDLIFGSHRSRGEILAKCFSAIDKIPAAALPGMLEGYGEGRTLRAVERYSRGTLGGLALHKRVNRKGGVVIANIGDASAGCGPVWEAMIFGAMISTGPCGARPWEDRRPCSSIS